MKKIRKTTPLPVLALSIGLALSTASLAVDLWEAKTAQEKVGAGNAILVDVREIDEIKETGMADVAQSMPMSEVSLKSPQYQKFMKSLDKNKVVVTYCRSGRRARLFAEQLENAGYKTATIESLDNWIKAGLPLKESAAPIVGKIKGESKANQEAKVSDLEKKIKRLAKVVVAPSINHLSEGDKKALRKIVEASSLMDEIYLRQVWRGNIELKAQLQADKSQLGQLKFQFFDQNKGPWARMDKNEAFLENVPTEKPAWAGYYPDDLTKKEFESWVSTLKDTPKAKAMGFFTVIQRNADKQLVAVPYSTEYKEFLEPAAKLLKEAAGLTTNESLKKFLKLRAEAFLRDDYYDSDVAWMDLDAPIDVTIGPYETYEDELFGYKAAFEAFVTLKDEKETQKLAKFSGYLQEIENHLPMDDKYKNPKLGSMAPIRVVDEVYAAGEAKRGVTTAAFNLPNDEKVTKEKGSKRVMLKNIQEAKFEKVLKPIAQRVLSSKEAKEVAFEPFFTHILMHELMHGIGPHNIKVGERETNVRFELKDTYSALEEAKADITGLFAMQYLMDKGAIDSKMQRSMYLTYLASAFRSVRFGITEAHGKGIALQFNFLTDEGAIKFTSKGKFEVDFEKIRPAVNKLTRELLTLQAEGAYERGKALLAKFAVVRPEMQKALDALKKVPVDIEPSFPLAESGNLSE